MEKSINTVYVDSDVHEDSIDIAAATAPRDAEARHLSTVPCEFVVVTEAMHKLVSAGHASLHIVCEGARGAAKAASPSQRCATARRGACWCRSLATSGTARACARSSRRAMTTFPSR